MSYYKLLGLDREPFSTSPDPAFFYLSQQHRSTLANLIIEFRLKRGLSVVLGDIGTGKTTLSRKMVQMLRDRPGFVFHLILDPTYSSQELFLSALLRTLGIELPPLSQPSLVDYRDALEKFLFRRAVEERQTVVLIIDEAHKLSPTTLESLRILLNYETNDAKLLQLVLLGQMELLPLLRSMPNLADRVSLKRILQPLGLDETQSMISFRLREAGYRSPVPLFSPEAIEEIWRYTQGYPRQISMICHQALRQLVMLNERTVQKNLIEQLVRHEIEFEWSPARKLQKSSYSV